jgi:DNA-binding NarL/FixJ family response regulator
MNHPGSTPPYSRSIRVSIVEDHQQIREGLSVLINGTPGYQCLGAFRSMEEALDRVPAMRLDVMLIDIGLPGMSGIEGINSLRQHYPDLPLLVLTVYDDDERIFNALCAGASGYLLKKTPPARLLESIREVVQGGAPMSAEVARRVISLFQKYRPRSADYQLTPHETRLLTMLVDGHNYKTAAAELGVSINTVSFHMRHVYEKLHVHSKSEAVSKAIREGLVR